MSPININHVLVDFQPSDSYNTTDFIAIKELSEELGTKFSGGYVIYTGDQIIPFGKNINACTI